MSKKFFISKNKSINDKILTICLRFSTYLILFIFALIVFRICFLGIPVLFKKDFPYVNTQFFLERPQTLVVFYDQNLEKNKMTTSEFEEFKNDNPDAIIIGKHNFVYSGGGIFSPLVGTIFIVTICIILAMGIGICASIYLSEYAKEGKFLSWIRLAILNLAGVPSIVYGLFGYSFFCFAFPVITSIPLERSILNVNIFGEYFISFQGWGQSMIASGCTLAVMILPVIITACEESLKAVPKGFREASLALGASKWETIRTNVLPYAIPGILTASILGITRVAGETAPIMYTGALAQGNLPWENVSSEGSLIQKAIDFFQSGVEALPYHIYTVSAKIPQNEAVKPMQNGSVFVFMFIVMVMATFSVLLRIKIRKKYKW